MKLDGEEKARSYNEWKAHQTRTERLHTHRGQAYSMIRGQCQQLLVDKMKHDPDWNTVDTSPNEPLLLISLIEKTILAQTEDQYPYATVYEQELSIYGFQQNTLSNEQYYEKFNTKIDIANAIGINWEHKALLEHQAGAKHGGATYDSLNDAEQAAVREEAKEAYLSFVMLKQAGKQHNKLRQDLRNDFTTGDNRYPQNRQQALLLLDKYSKSAVVQPAASEGNSFFQKGKQKGQGGGKKHFDEEFFKDKNCHKCGKKGHPKWACEEEKPKKPKKNSKSDDDQSRSSKGSKSSKASLAGIKKDLKKQFKQTKKSFATLTTQLEELENDSDLTESDDENSSASSFLTLSTTLANLSLIHI